MTAILIDALSFIGAITVAGGVGFIAGSRWEITRQAGKQHPPRHLTIQERIAALKPEIKEGKETA
jgi:hypothetical protein